MKDTKIIPTLFALNKEEFDSKLDKISFVPDIHIDFMDGNFTDKKSVLLNEMEKIKDYSNNFQIHLMAREPEEYVSKIKKLGIKRVFIHYEVFETDTELFYAIELIKEKELEIGLVINPGTEVEEIFPYIDDIDCVLIMCVWPGREGQSFISNSYSRIKKLRDEFSNLEICVDGGINADNVKQIVESGANTLFVGSYVSSNGDSKKNYENLMNLIK